MEKNRHLRIYNGCRALYDAALLDDKVVDLRKWAENTQKREVFRELDRADEEKSLIQRVDELRREVSRIRSANNLVASLGLNADASEGELESARKAALLRRHYDKLPQRHPHLEGLSKDRVNEAAKRLNSLPHHRESSDSDHDDGSGSDAGSIGHDRRTRSGGRGARMAHGTRAPRPRAAPLLTAASTYS